MYRMAAKIDEVLLIELVRKHECLYNMKSKHYRDQNMRGEAWEEIAQAMNIAGDALKIAWNKLRNCYFNAQKRRKTKSGQAATKLVKWKFEKEMEFLLPYLETRQTQTNLIEETQELNHEDDEDVVHETMESQDEQELSVNNSTLSRNSIDLVVKKQTPTRRQTSTSAEQLVNIMKENAELRRSRYKNVPKPEGYQSTLDEIDMFFLSMAKTVKRLSPIDQATIRMKMCTMISEAEIRQMRSQEGLQTYQTDIPLTSSSSFTSTASTTNQRFSPPPPRYFSQTSTSNQRLSPPPPRPFSQASTSNQPFSPPPSTPFSLINYDNGQIEHPAQDAHMQYTTFQDDPSI